MRTCLTLAAALLVAAPAAADEPKLYSASAKLTKPKSDKDSRTPKPLDEVRANLWLPDGVPVVRGLVVNPFYSKAVEQEQWRAPCRHWGFGIVGADYFGTSQADYAPTLQAMLKQFAADSGRPEVEHAPLCFVGMSAGAGMSAQFAEQMPERVIAAGLVCLEVGPRGPACLGVPMVTVFGEKDGRQMEQLAEKLPPLRAEHARWATAVQWGRKHEFARAGNLVAPLFDSAIARRYPKDADPRKGPVKLLDVAEKDGWLGDPSARADGEPAVAPFAEYKGDAGKACWLPDAGTAAVWRAFVTKGPRLTITDPPGLGDGKPFASLPADAPVEVRLSVKADFKPAKVELFDRDVRLAEFADGVAKVGGLPAGVHVLIAVATDADGRRHPSPPNAVFVAK